MSEKICEEKAVENIIKARRRGRKRGGGKKTITVGEQRVKQHISRKRRGEQKTNRVKEVEIFWGGKNSNLRQSFVCLSTSRSQYGAVHVLQDTHRSV